MFDNLLGLYKEYYEDLLEKGLETGDLAGSVSLLEARFRNRKDILKHPSFVKLHERLEKLTKEKFLLPPYAFHDYAVKSSFSDLLKERKHSFAEVSSTYTEYSREEVQKSIRRGNDFVRKATQLAYDSGKIDKQEYEYRMGTYCKSNECGPCLIYTLPCKK